MTWDVRTRASDAVVEAETMIGCREAVGLGNLDAFRFGLLAASERPLSPLDRSRLRRLMSMERRIGRLLVDGEADFARHDARLASVEQAIAGIEERYLKDAALG